jgi:hypothetical protein
LLYSKRWVFYVKRPFGGPKQVLSYLANYTHRVALSKRRIVAVDAQHQTVTFTNKEAAGIQVLPTRSLFGGDIPRRFLPRVSLAKPTSAPLQF